MNLNLLPWMTIHFLLACAAAKAVHVSQKKCWEKTYVPYCSRCARISGRPALRIDVCVFATSYATRKNCTVSFFESKMMNDDAGLRSRGWPTEPGLMR